MISPITTLKFFDNVNAKGLVFLVAVLFWQENIGV